MRYLALLAAALLSFSVHAQDGKITVVAPFPPGGPVDTLARILADGLGKRNNIPALVDNAPGAAGNIGMDKVKRAKPDGRTLLVIPAGNLTINPTLMPKFPFNIEKDFAPITMLAKTPNVLVTGPGVKFRNVQELITIAKQRPDSLSYASPGIGSGLHLAGEMFKAQTGTDILHVAYKGTPPALNDVLAGTVPLMFSNLSTVLPHLRSGRLLALGLTDTQRSPVAPEIPTLSEQGVTGVVVTSWYGLLAPAGTPTDVLDKLAQDARDILTQPAVLEQIRGQGMTESLMKPSEFSAHIRSETVTWSRVIKARNITVE